MDYPVRCRIVNPTGEVFAFGLVKQAPPESMPHIGKEGLAEEVGENIRITLDDGTIIWGYECWWEPSRPPKRQEVNDGKPATSTQRAVDTLF